MKEGPSYPIHMTRCAIPALAEEQSKSDHRLGPPWPRGPWPAGDANVGRR